MAQKAEIQYVREFYVFGSEAPQPKQKPEKPKLKRPKVRLERLQQILLFRELEFPLKEIRGILNAPNFDRHKALEQQIELLTLK